MSDNDYKDTYKPQYLYIEQYYTDPSQTKEKEEPENDDAERGVIVIDIL